MVTFDNATAPTFRELMIFKLTNLAMKRARTSKASIDGSRITAVLNTTMRLVLHVAGFGLLTMAGFKFNIMAGLIVAGISCFLLSTLMTRNAATPETTEVRRAPDLRTGR